MFTRTGAVGLALTALVFSAALAADKGAPTADNTLEGSVSSVMDGKVSILDKEGKKITTFKVGKDLEIIRNGKKGDLKDLKKDLPVVVTYKVERDNVLTATKIESNTEKPGK